MTMPKMQLNSKVVNNILLEWGRFVIAVNLNRGLKTSNYDQLYAYLKQYEAHANENKMMLERYNQHAIITLAFDRQNRGQGNNTRGAVVAGNQGFQNRVGNANPGQAKPIKCYKCNEIGHIENGVVLDEEQLLFITGGQTNTFDDDVDEAPVQDLAFNEDHVFQANQYDAFDSNVDEAPTAQTMFMANLSSADPIYDEASPSYDSDILSEVQDHDNYLDSVDEYQEVHKMHNDVQQNYVVDSDAEYTSDSNIILYYQYAAQCVSANEHNKVVNESLTVELARYKEQVMIYEKRERKNKRLIHALKDPSWIEAMQEDLL
ncbi:hypothetical protein Tco_0328036 [Tanacetum coccineum]